MQVICLSKKITMGVDIQSPLWYYNYRKGKVIIMRCVECPCYFWDDYEEMEICHADPNWPVPCEYDDEPEEEEDEEV